MTVTQLIIQIPIALCVRIWCDRCQADAQHLVHCATVIVNFRYVDGCDTQSSFDKEAKESGSVAETEPTGPEVER